MKIVVLGAIACFFLIACIAGCGPSHTQQANHEVNRLTHQAERHFEMGQLDEAQETIDQALAIKGATHRQTAIAMAKKIRGEQQRRDTEQFDQETTILLDQAAALTKTDGPEAAVILISKSLSDRYWPEDQTPSISNDDTPKKQNSSKASPPPPRASATHRKLAHKLLQQVQNATSWAHGRQYWKTFELESLVDFREKDYLPEGWESAITNQSPHAAALRSLWAMTLRRTLAEALATAEIEADREDDPDHSLPSPTIEEVAANPKAWQGKEVQFDRVWIDGKIRVSKKHGWLLTITSQAGEVYKPLLEQDAFIFATRGTVAKRLESFVSPDERVRACIFCKIGRGRKTGAVYVTPFYQAIVFKVELYTKPDEE